MPAVNNLDMSSSNKMDFEKEVKNVVKELCSGRGTSLYGALIMLRTTLIKSRIAVNQLLKTDFVKLLVQLLEEKGRHVNHTKTTDIVLSILANLCMEEDFREKIVGCDGLSKIAQATMASEQESIQNRGIRALANLSQDTNNSDIIVGMEVPVFVAKRLMETEDPECQSTYCRALRLLGQTPKGVKRLVEDTQAIQALAALLKLDNKKLTLKSLRTLAEFSAVRCCPSFTGQILAANVLEELVTLADDDDSDTAYFSLSIVLRLCDQEHIRPALGSAGMISLLVRHMTGGRNFVNKVLTLNALCLCTKESVNRGKIRDAGGLELLVSALQVDDSVGLAGGQFSVLYDRIISSLVNFLYSDDCLGKLLQLGLVKVLSEHLMRCCQFSLDNENLRKDISVLVDVIEQQKQVVQERPESSGHMIKDIESGTSGNMQAKSCDAIEQNEAKSPFLTAKCIENNTENCAFFTKSCENSDIHDVGTYSESDNYSGHDPDIEGLDETEMVDGNDDPLIIDKDRRTNSQGIVIDEEMTADETNNLSSSDDTVDLPLPPNSSSRHTFSINSPTYQAETSWKLEDFTSGVTCKTFTPEQDAHRLSPTVTYTSQASPFSPLSAGASYYSPSQSSPSHSVTHSPRQSSLTCSPASSSDSPNWSLASSESTSLAHSNRSFSPTYHSPNRSPASPGYQNQFSPLSNSFPSSPSLLFDEREPESPVFNSQMSLLGQTASQDYATPPGERSQNRTENDLYHSQDDCWVDSSTSSSKFQVVPLKTDFSMLVNPVYSASEDEEDESESVSHSQSSRTKAPQLLRPCSWNRSLEVGKSKMDLPESSEHLEEGLTALLNKTSPRFGENSLSDDHEIHDKIEHSSQEYEQEYQVPTSRLKHASSQPSPKRGAGETNMGATCKGKARKRRKLNPEIDDGVHSSNHHESVPVPRFSDDVDHSPVAGDQSVNALSKVPQRLSLKDNVRSATEKQAASENLMTQCEQEFKHNQGKSSLSSVKCSPRVHKPFSSSSFSPTLVQALSPLASTVPHMSKRGASPLTDSPYRSPFSDKASSPRSSQEGLKDSKTPMVNMRFSNINALHHHKASTNSKKNVSEKDLTDSCNTNHPHALARVNKHHVQTTDGRVKKILRTSECNILILLSRISLKPHPNEFLAETSIMNCLLAYLSRAANPIRRCSRILDRLCGNPLIFEKLILLQVPALLVKYLVLEEDGTFPTVMFCTEWENQFGILQRSRMNVSDLFPSSQSSDNTGSPASELGRLMDLEFGGDAYSRMVSSKAISVRSFYRGRPSLSVESQAARDGSSSDDVYEAGCNRSQVRVQLGLKLLHSLGSVAMSNFGRGEIQHALTHRTPPDRLASLISLLYIPFGCEHAPTRRSFIRQYNLWDQLLPCLFIPEAPRAREAIVAGVSLNLHLESPAKCVRLVPKLFLNHEAAGQNPLSEVVTLTSHGQSTSDNTRGSTTEPGGETLGSEKEEKPGDGKGGCPYARKSHDVTFVIHEDGTTHRYKVNKQDMVQKSSIFAAMLAGSYIESTKSEIVISEVNPAVFEFIVHYLHGCSIGCRVIDSITPKCAASADHRENKKQQPNAILEFQILDDNGCQQVTSDIPVLDSNKGSRSGLHRQCVASPAPNEEVPGDATPEVKLDRNSLHSMNDLTQSQESLDSLTLEDRNDGTETSQSYPGIFTSENHLENNETETMSPSERGADKLLQLVNKCADILVVADQFLLSDLLSYVCSILSHVCLQPNTSETIFPLACFYKLDALAVDCMRETLLSNLSSQEAAAIYVDLGASGYKDQAIMALSNLLNKAFKD